MFIFLTKKSKLKWLKKAVSENNMSNLKNIQNIFKIFTRKSKIASNSSKI